MRQPVLFVLVGGLQYVFDATLFGLLIAAGMPTAGANVLSRVSAAALGFGLNRYVTFRQRDETWRRLASSLGRFAVLFIVLTLISTAALLGLEESFGGGVAEKVAYKVAIEAVLAVLSFLASKYWVFRR